VGSEPRPAALPSAVRHDPNAGPLRAVLHALYDAAWCAAGVLGVPWFLWKSRRVPEFARMIRAQLGRGLAPLAPKDRPRVLIHGVSVGEIKGAQSLVRALREEHPEIEVVVSSTTNTGFEVASRLFPGVRVVRFPIDVSPVVRRFLERVDPDWVVLVELEIWPNFLRECNRRGVPMAVVNGRITPRSHGRYRLFRRLLPQFNRISAYCVQSEEYAHRFRDLGVEPARILVTGNLKADGLPAGAGAAGETRRRLLAEPPERLCIVAGSTHAPEEVRIARAWRRAAPEARLIVVPRHPQRSPEVLRELEQEGIGAQRWTSLVAGEERSDPARMVVVDTIGELEAIYALADVAFVGGSLVRHGGQNVLEPAAQGKPVLFGPSMENFVPEATLLLSEGGAWQVPDEDGLASALGALARDPERRARMGRAARAAVETQRGATRRTLAALEGLGLFRRGGGARFGAAP